MHLCTKFQFCISTRFGDTLGCTPKFLGVTWPRPRPFSGFFFAGFWDIATLHLCTKFEVSTSTRFGDRLGCTPKFIMVTWPRPRPFSGFFFAGFWDIASTHLCAKFQVSSSTRFGDTLGCTPKFWGVTWPRPRPFSGFSFVDFWDIAPVHLHTKFQISSSTRFGDMLTRANYQIHWSAHIKGQNRTAHAPWHVTWGLGVRNNRIFGIPDPDLSIHYTAFRGLRWRLRIVYLWASPSWCTHWWASINSHMKIVWLVRLWNVYFTSDIFATSFDCFLLNCTSLNPRPIITVYQCIWIYGRRPKRPLVRAAPHVSVRMLLCFTAVIYFIFSFPPA